MNTNALIESKSCELVVDRVGVMEEVSGMEKRNQVLEALANWVIYVTDKKEMATPEEVEALPKVAEVFLKN